MISNDTSGPTRWRVLMLLFASIMGTSAPAADSAGNTSSSQHYVLLRNDHVLHGNVTVHGSMIQIRRGPNSELTLRSDQVFAIREDLVSLFEVRQSMKRRRAQSSLAELLDDARWCVDQQMPNQATSLLMKVYETSPDHPVAQQLEARLRRWASGVDGVGDRDAMIPTNERISKASFTTGQQASLAGPLDGEGQHDTRSLEADTPNLNHTNAPQELPFFTTRVQPILLSRCGNCHGADSSREWKLTLPHSGTRVSQAGTLVNLKSTLDFCRAGQPDTSDLFRMATQAHGSSPHLSPEPPIAPHEMRLIRTLYHWIANLPQDSASDRNRQTNGNSSTPPITPTPPITSTPPTSSASLEVDSEVDSEGRENDRFEQPELTQAEPAEVLASLEPPPPTSPRTPWTPPSASSLPRDSNRPVRLPSVSNPDDVRHFNRETEIRRLFGF